MGQLSFALPSACVKSKTGDGRTDFAERKANSILIGGNMKRRDFHRKIARAAFGAALAPAVPLLAETPRPASPDAGKAPFQLSIMLWTVFRDMPFEERLEKVAEAGYRNVELVGEFKKWSDDDYRMALRKKHELGITFDTTAGLEHGVGNPGERDAMLADVKGLLKVCDRLECPSMIIMSGNVVPTLSREQQHQSCIEGLKRAAELVEGKNMRLLIENIDPEENPHYFLQSVAEGFEIIRAVDNPQVRFLYDFYHEQIAEGNLIEKLEKNIDLVGLCHIADVPGRHEPGTGEIDYTNIYRKLAELNFSHYVAMEFLPRRDPVETLRRAGQEALSAARV
jgi:hydroxypyruvate isomerase